MRYGIGLEVAVGGLGEVKGGVVWRDYLEQTYLAAAASPPGILLGELSGVMGGGMGDS